MTRRSMFALFAIGAGKKVSLPDLWHDLLAQMQTWAELYNQTVPGTLNAAAVRQWEVVRKAFHEVDVAVRNL